MPGNLRKKLVKGGPSERQYLRARRQVLRESGICTYCHNAIDMTLKPICVNVNTRGYTVETAHEIPLTCGPECKHRKKPNPWSGSADHVIPVEQLPAGSPLLTSKKNLAPHHLVCNQRKSNKSGAAPEKFVSSGDWF